MPLLLLALSLALAAASPAIVCAGANASGRAWCDARLSFRARSEALARALTALEAASLMGNSAAGVERLGLPPYEWWNEGLHGVAQSPGVSFVAPTSCATSFPQVIGTASSWDEELFFLIARAISTEGRAFHNVGHAGLTFWTPNLNVAVDPRWGRLQETPGESASLNARYGLAFVRGLENQNASGHLQASACVKHFDAYHLETQRFSFDGNVSQYDLENTYLVPFRATLPHASCTMCAYVAVNGVPSCANSLLMTKLARKEWGFNGYITSDCGAVNFVQNRHHYTGSALATVDVTLSAGMDLDCGVFVPQHLVDALSAGAVPRATVDAALANLFEVQMRLGLFDGSPYDHITPASINTVEHQRLAYRAALESMVLLKRAHLPWKPLGKQRIAIIGPNANATATMQGNYYGVAPYLVSPLQAFVAELPDLVVYTKGCDIDSNSTQGFLEARAAASTADMMLLVMGLDQTQEAEGLDRTSLKLPGVQAQLIDEVLAVAAGRPVVLALMCGGPVDVEPWMHVANLDILWLGYPGQEGGNALRDLILGRASPSGKLTQTWYPSSFTSRVRLQDMRMRADAQYPGRTYRYYTGTPLFRFGHGLSYSRFTVEWVGATQAAVTNVGDMEAAEVVMRFDKEGDGRLLGFQRVTLKPGEKRVISVL